MIGVIEVLFTKKNCFMCSGKSETGEVLDGITSGCKVCMNRCILLCLCDIRTRRHENGYNEGVGLYGR